MFVNQHGDVNRCLAVYTSLKTDLPGNWYFDSGCSRHMTDDKTHLTDFKSVNGGNVTYGGGAKGKITGK